PHSSLGMGHSAADDGGIFVAERARDGRAELFDLGRAYDVYGVRRRGRVDARRVRFMVESARRVLGAGGARKLRSDGDLRKSSRHRHLWPIFLSWHREGIERERFQECLTCGRGFIEDCISRWWL